MQRLRILSAALLIVVASGCTVDEFNLFARWHTVDPFTTETVPMPPSADGQPAIPAVMFDALAAHVAELEALPACLLYDRWIDEAGLPAHFHAVMRRESMCQPDAYNSSGASGLFQILRTWASSCGTTAAGLFDPYINIRCAVYVYGVQGGQAWSTW